MVDDMVGGVGGGVLLDSDLGDMVDLVVDLVTNLVDNGGSGNMVGSRGNSNCGSWSNMVVGNRSNSNSRGSSLHLDSLDSSNCRGSNCVVSNRGSDRDDWGSVGDRVNKAILVDIFRESLQRQRGIATVGSDKVTHKRGERSTS